MYLSKIISDLNIIKTVFLKYNQPQVELIIEFIELAEKDEKNFINAITKDSVWTGMGSVFDIGFNDEKDLIIFRTACINIVKELKKNGIRHKIAEREMALYENWNNMTSF